MMLMVLVMIEEWIWYIRVRIRFVFFLLPVFTSSSFHVFPIRNYAVTYSRSGIHVPLVTYYRSRIHVFYSSRIIGHEFTCSPLWVSNLRSSLGRCLLGPPPQTHMKSINDIMPMIGARFYTQLDAAQVKSDVLEGELAKVRVGVHGSPVITRLVTQPTEQLFARPRVLHREAQWLQ